MKEIHFVQLLDWIGLFVFLYHAEVAVSLAPVIFLRVFFPSGNFDSPLNIHVRGDKLSGLWGLGWVDRDEQKSEPPCPVSHTHRSSLPPNLVPTLN